MKFRSDEDGYITALRFYKQPNNTGTHVGHLWSGTGQLLAAATFTNETASGWQQAELPNPVPVTKDTTYVTSYHASAGPLRLQPRASSRRASTARRCTRPRDGLDGGNGVYQLRARAASRTRPSTRRTTGSTPPSTGPSRRTRAARRSPSTEPDAGATDVPRARRHRHLRRADRPGRPSRRDLHAARRGRRLVAADVSYDAQTRMAKLMPQAPLAVLGTTYTARLKGGAGGRDRRGRQPARRRPHLVVHHRAQSPAEGPGGPILP